MIFARKMPEFYIIIARKIFSPNFRGHVPPAPVSYAYAIPLPLKSSYGIWGGLSSPHGVGAYGVAQPSLVTARLRHVSESSENTTTEIYSMWS